MQIKWKYRVKRIHIEKQYKWILQASLGDTEHWVIVTNMQARVPVYNTKKYALEISKKLQEAKTPEEVIG